MTWSARSPLGRFVAAAIVAFGTLLAGCGSGRPSTSGTGGSAGGSGGSSECSAADGTLASVASIVVSRCATAGCHDTVTLQSGMDLSTAEMIHHNWVGVRGLDQCTDTPTFRVLPGHPDGSFVMTKIKAQGVLCARATRMPPPPAAMLSACEIETIRAWIGAGAPADATSPDAGSDGGLDDGGSDAVDGSDDGGADGPDVDPTACTNARACDSLVEICVEVEPTSMPDNCSSHWQCFSHDYDDPDDGGELAHMCPPEIVTFCGCDGKEFQASWACPGMPYDHIGACSDGYSCDADRVRCANPAPTCPDGQAPAVIAGCWGPCVPIEMCRCDQNWRCPTTLGYRCVTVPDFRCEPMPSPSDGGADVATD